MGNESGGDLEGPKWGASRSPEKKGTPKRNLNKTEREILLAENGTTGRNESKRRGGGDLMEAREKSLR